MIEHILSYPKIKQILELHLGSRQQQLLSARCNLQGVQAIAASESVLLLRFDWRSRAFFAFIVVPLRSRFVALSHDSHPHFSNLGYSPSFVLLF